MFGKLDTQIDKQTDTLNENLLQNLTHRSLKHPFKKFQLDQKKKVLIDLFAIYVRRRNQSGHNKKKIRGLESRQISFPH